MLNIKCEICKIKNKVNCLNNEFYKCLTCDINICPTCKSFHKSNHFIINYEQKNYACNKHNQKYIKYCNKCYKNICYLCKDEHKKHMKISFNDIKPNINEINNNLNEIKKELNLFKDNIKEIINILNELANIIDIYYEIHNNILMNYEEENTNFQIIQNVKQINENNEINNILNNINKSTNIKDKLYNIINLYNNINSEKEIKNKSIELDKDISNDNVNISSNNKLNEMTIIYKIVQNENEIKLFGRDFVYNNKNNCYLIIDDQQKELCVIYHLNDAQKNETTLKINLSYSNFLKAPFILLKYILNLIKLQLGFF